ncbi:MAG: ASKHA domain-containing protein [Desulfovibrionaceae bacterium]
MPKIRFLPDGLEVQVDPGCDLLTAAKRLDIPIDAECGGQGTCKACLVRVQQGAVEDDGRGWLPVDVKEEGFVLACTSQVRNEDVLVEVPGREGATCAESAATAAPEQPEPEPCPEPMARTVEAQVPEAQPLDGLADQDRLARAAAVELDGETPLLRLPALRELAAALRAEDGRVKAGAAWADQDAEILRAAPASSNLCALGAAVDIGTTTLGLRLIDLDTGRVLAETGALNPQIACGLDVISRINYAQREGGLAELARLIRRGLARLLRQACERAGCDPGDVLAVSAAGNTVMVHLWLGLDPDRLRLAPYTPTVMAPLGLRARDLGLPANPFAPVEIAPAVGSYVGGDVTAGLFQTDIPTSDPVSLYIDIGTNGEAAVGNADFLLACACSAGPAFEGAGLTCGMRASQGAVERVEIDPDTGVPALSVIGDVPARGVCGSGVISLLARLFRTGWLDAAGRLDRSRECERIRQRGRKAEYVLAFPGEGPEVYVTENDISAAIRAKAAIFAGCRRLLEQVGLDFGDIERVMVAGGFGRFLDVEDAVTLGLLPDMPREAFTFSGNASLAGAETILRRRSDALARRDLAGRITYVDLSTDHGYMDQYTAAAFIPHTEEGLFGKNG